MVWLLFLSDVHRKYSHNCINTTHTHPIAKTARARFPSLIAFQAIVIDRNSPKKNDTIDEVAFQHMIPLFIQKKIEQTFLIAKLKENNSDVL